MGGGVWVPFVDLELMGPKCVLAEKGFRAKLTGMGGGVMSLEMSGEVGF